MGAWNTQRIADVYLHLLHLHALFVDLLAKFFRDVLFEFFFDEIRNSRFDGPVDLDLDLTRVKN